MSYGGTNERIKQRRGYRTPLDMGMGLFYVVIGGIVMVLKSFGNVAIPPIFAYPIGVLMVVGGCYRFYRGLKDILPEKKDN